MAAVVLVVLVFVAALVVATLRSSGGGSPLSEVGRFAAAREVTNRWSDDPSSTPGPLRDYLSQQRPAPVEPDDDGS